jgi:hypothetical protein
MKEFGSNVCHSLTLKDVDLGDYELQPVYVSNPNLRKIQLAPNSDTDGFYRPPITIFFAKHGGHLHKSSGIYIPNSKTQIKFVTQKDKGAGESLKQTIMRLCGLNDKQARKAIKEARRRKK